MVKLKEDEIEITMRDNKNGIVLSKIVKSESLTEKQLERIVFYINDGCPPSLALELALGEPND